MFFEGFAPLLTRASEALEGEVLPHVEDAHARNQVAAISVLLGDLGRMWPGLFSGLLEENERLEALCRYARDEESSAETLNSAPEDPLARHRALLDDASLALHALHAAGKPAAERLREARRLLVHAAAVSQQLAATPPAAVGTAGVRR